MFINTSRPANDAVWSFLANSSFFNLIASNTQGKILFESLKKKLNYQMFKYALSVPLDMHEDGKDLENYLPTELFKRYRQERVKIKEDLERLIVSTENRLSNLVLDIYKTSFDPGRRRLISEDEIFFEWVLRLSGDSLRNYSSSGFNPSLPVHDGTSNKIGSGIIRVARTLILKDLAKTSGLKESFEYFDHYIGNALEGLVFNTRSKNDIVVYVQQVQKEACSQALLP